MMSNGRGDMSGSPEFSVDRSKEGLDIEQKKKIFGNIREVEERLVPCIDAVLSGEENLAGANWSKITAFLTRFDFLSLEFYKQLSRGGEDSQFFHDMNNFVMSVSNYREFLLNCGVTPRDKSIKYLKIFRENVIPYMMIMGDLLARDKDEFISGAVERRNLNINGISESLEVLSKSGAVGGLVGQKFKFEKIDNDFLESGEEILSVSGVVTNALMNEIRNSSSERIGATQVKLKIKREGDELVFQVVDDGIGMRRHHLEQNYVVSYDETVEDKPFSGSKSDSGYIFEKGKKSSGTGSTGLGITNLDKRIVSIDGVLRVASKRKFESGKQGEQINFTTEQSEEKMPDIELGENQSTIFEIRLPITKKK